MDVKTVVLEGEVTPGCNCDAMRIGETDVDNVFYDYATWNPQTRIRATITIEVLPTVTVEGEVV